jgi:signal transduction histidine kinase
VAAGRFGLGRRPKAACACLVLLAHQGLAWGGPAGPEGGTTWGLVGGLTLLGAACLPCALWAWRRLRRRRASAHLQSRREVRRAERQRIASELDDSLLQGFHGLMLQFQAATERIPEDLPARKLMEAALDRADLVLVEGRHRLVALRVDDSRP